MSEDSLLSSCFVCCRSLQESRFVKGSTRLRHSNKLVHEAISDIVNEPVSALKLCFRCYRLVLGIDYHEHELNRLMQSFTKIFDERRNLDENNKKKCVAEVINRSVMLSSEDEAQIQEQHNDNSICVGGDNPESKLAEPNTEQLQLEFFEEDSRGTVTYTPSTVENQIEVSKEEVEDNDDKKYTPSTTNFDSDNIKSETNEIELDLDSILIHSRRRQKVPKKYDDFEYYSESYSQQNVPSAEKEFGPETLDFRSPFKCTLCQNYFTSKKSFSCHECFKKEKEDITYQCKGCQEIFQTRKDYIKHIDLCYKNVPVECHVCLSKLPSAAYLPRHIEAFHRAMPVNKKNTLCEHCGRGFSRKEGLERHQARVHGLAHGIHQCPECGCTFLHTSLLAEHMRAHKGYMCAICKKSFSCMSNLNLHSKAHHQKVASYTCSACNKSWKFHASYTYHMRKVHGSSLLKCPSCKECFSTQRGLMHHKKRCSSGQDEPNTRTLTEEKIEKEETVCDPICSPSVKTSSKTIGKKPLRTRRVRATPYTTSENKSSKDQEATVAVCGGIENQEQEINLFHSQNTLDLPQQVSIHGREEGHEIMEPGSLTVEVAEISSESKDSLLLVPELPEEEELIYEVEEEETMEAPSNDIVVETLDDLTNDCHYVILVEEGGEAME